MLTSTETSNSGLSLGLCAQQNSPHNYVMTILKTQFLRETLHHAKKMNFIRRDLWGKWNLPCKYAELMSFDLESCSVSIGNLVFERTAASRLHMERQSVFLW